MFVYYEGTGDKFNQKRPSVVHPAGSVSVIATHWVVFNGQLPETCRALDLKRSHDEVV